MENVKTQRYQACNNEKKKEIFRAETSYHTTKQFLGNLLEMKKSKSVYNKTNLFRTIIIRY